MQRVANPMVDDMPLGEGKKTAQTCVSLPPEGAWLLIYFRSCRRTVSVIGVCSSKQKLRLEVSNCAMDVRPHACIHSCDSQLEMAGTHKPWPPKFSRWSA